MNNYKPNILIVGDSGDGKSTSYESLPQDGTTRIIETECKALPFFHKFPKLTHVESVDEFNKAIDVAKADTECKYLVIDSISKHLERCLSYCRTTQKGYDIWNLYGRMGQNLMNQLHSTKQVIIAISLAELVETETNETGAVQKVYKRMAATNMGNELRGKFDKEFTIVLHTKLTRDTTGKMSFNFLVKPDGLTTAKTPKSMFPGKTLVQNDVKLVIDEMAKLGAV